MFYDDPDLDDAIANLSHVDRSPGGLSRRRFLQAAAVTSGGIAAVSAFGPSTRAGAAPVVADGTLIVINLNGGNDGLNMVVPTENSVYYAKRPTIAIPAASTLSIGGGFGLHPRLKFLKQRFDAGQLAVINGVGYPNYNRSHFESMRIWQEGWAGPSSAQSGWLGRWNDSLAGSGGPVAAVTISDAIPYSMLGRDTRAVALGDTGAFFGTAVGAGELRLYSAIRAMAGAPTGLGPWADLEAQTLRQLVDTGQKVAPAYEGSFPTSWFGRRMTIVARLLNANVGVRVVNIDADGGFDTHSDELRTHDNNYNQLDLGIQAFFAALTPALAAKVTIVIVSEFGRQLDEDDTAGTDHGTANVVLALGGSVRGGLFGALPSLTNLLDGSMLNFSVDFRSVYRTLIDHVIGGDATALLGANFPDLGFVTTVVTPAPTTTTTVATTVAPTTVATVVATTVATTAATTTTPTTAATTTAATTTTPTTAATTTTPTTAATTTAATTTTPTTAATTTTPTTAATTTTATTAATTTTTAPSTTTTTEPSTTTTTPSTGGGAVCPFDQPGAFTAVFPTRMLDSRSGRGMPQGRRRKLQQGETIEVRVTGKGRVPGPDVTAVLINVTALGPTAEGFIAVWPAGDPMPPTSNLNVQPGRPVSNLVVVKVNGKGRVALFNSAGRTNVVMDVVGFFSTGGGSLLTPLSPRRVLDTRVDRRPLGKGSALRLPLAGVAGLPASGVTAVLLNMTVTEPDGTGDLCVWSSGEAKPDVTMVSFSGGQTVPNLVLAAVSADGAVDVHAAGAATHVVADVVGFFSPSCGEATMISTTPTRVLDTRTAGAALASDSTAMIQLAGTAGLPTAGISAVVLNVTVIRPTRAGYLTVWPDGEAQPVASNLNFVPRQTVPNMVLAKLGTNGAVDLRVSAGQAHVVVDVLGYFS